MSEAAFNNAHDALKALGGNVEFFEAGGTVIKAFGLPAGTEVGQHAHDYDHLSVLVAGEAMVEVGDERTIYTAPYVLTIKAGHIHKITAIQDSLWLCVHNTDRLEAHA